VVGVRDGLVGVDAHPQPTDPLDSTVMVSPGCSGPTPAGVPVAMTLPGQSVSTEDA
jgi:hypothetical protein